MGWAQDVVDLLDDLESEAAARFHAAREPEWRDRSRAAYQEVSLASRLMASLDSDLRLDVRGVGVVAGRLTRVGAGWGLVEGAAQEWLVRWDAVAAVHGVSERSVPEVAWSPLTRISWGGALRGLAERGERVVLHRLDGVRHDAEVTRVGKDFAELAEGEPPRPVLVAFAALAAVQSVG